MHGSTLTPRSRPCGMQYDSADGHLIRSLGNLTILHTMNKSTCVSSGLFDRNASDTERRSGNGFE